MRSESSVSTPTTTTSSHEQEEELAKCVLQSRLAALYADLSASVYRLRRLCSTLESPSSSSSSSVVPSPARREEEEEEEVRFRRRVARGASREEGTPVRGDGSLSSRLAHLLVRGRERLDVCVDHQSSMGERLARHADEYAHIVSMYEYCVQLGRSLLEWSSYQTTTNAHASWSGEENRVLLGKDAFDAWTASGAELEWCADILGYCHEEMREVFPPKRVIPSIPTVDVLVSMLEEKLQCVIDDAKKIHVLLETCTVENQENHGLDEQETQRVQSPSSDSHRLVSTLATQFDSVQAAILDLQECFKTLSLFSDSLSLFDGSRNEK